MAKIGDRVQVSSSKVGQLPREGIVTGVSGAMLRMTWSTGEESTLVPSAGAVVVIPKAKAGSGSVTETAKSARIGRAPVKPKSPTRKPAG